MPTYVYRIYLLERKYIINSARHLLRLPWGKRLQIFKLSQTGDHKDKFTYYVCRGGKDYKFLS
jgi:hypothetical protein